MAKNALGLVGNFTAFGGSVQAVMATISKVWPELEKWAERVGASEQLAEVKTAADELAAAAGETFQEVMARGGASAQAFVASISRGAIDGKAFEEWLGHIKDRTVEVIRGFQGLVEAGRAPENRRLAALDAQLKAISEDLTALDAQMKSLQSGDWASRLLGPSLESLERQRAALVERQALLQKIRTERMAGIDLGEAIVNVESIERATEALEKQNAELRIRIATFGMAAGAAAEYVAIQRAMNEAGVLWNVTSDEQRAKIFEQARLTRVLTDRGMEAQRKVKQASEAERKDKQFDRDLAGAERELERARAQEPRRSRDDGGRSGQGSNHGGEAAGRRPRGARHRRRRRAAAADQGDR